MNDISKILIPYNFSNSAERALDYAVAFSKGESDTTIRLLYVSDTQIGPKEKEHLDKKFGAIKESYLAKTINLKIDWGFNEGEIVNSILEAKNEFEADVIVMGTKGINKDTQYRNTNTSCLVEKAECPVLVVPQTFEDFKIENITLAIDKNEIEEPEHLMTLLAIARRFDAKIHVLTVYEENDKDYLKERENENVLEYYFEKYYSRSSSTMSANIAQSIIDYDTKQAIDMLAIIPRNHSKKNTPSQGRLTKYLTTSTNIPVLTID